MLPKLVDEAKSESLSSLLAEHLQQTLGHVANVERVFHLAAGEVSSNLDRAAEKLFEQHDEQAAGVVEDVLRDVFHAAGASATEHHELAQYDVLIELAGVLGLEDARDLLRQNRKEDAAALEQAEKALARLARELR